MSNPEKGRAGEGVWSDFIGVRRAQRAPPLQHVRRFGGWHRATSTRLVWKEEHTNLAWQKVLGARGPLGKVPLPNKEVLARTRSGERLSLVKHFRILAGRHFNPSLIPAPRPGALASHEDGMAPSEF